MRRHKLKYLVLTASIFSICFIVFVLRETFNAFEKSVEQQVYNDSLVRAREEAAYANDNKSQWIKYNCMKAQYFLKLDNDVFMNTRVVLDYIFNKSMFNPSELSFSGEIWNSSHPFRVRSRWFVSYETFPDRIYKLYAHGHFYIMINQLPSLLYNLTFTINDFWYIQKPFKFFFSCRKYFPRIFFFQGRCIQWNVSRF